LQNEIESASGRSGTLYYLISGLSLFSKDREKPR